MQDDRINIILTSPRWIILSALILGLGAVWIWVTALPYGSAPVRDVSAPHVGFLAPDFSLRSDSGETITLSELRGNPVLINFWASWCPPCRTEMPAIQEVYEEYTESGFVVLAVNTTYQDNQGDAVTFGMLHKLTFSILWDQTGEVSRVYQINALPTSFFVDRLGIIREVVIGGPMAEALLRSRTQRILGD
jgi:peroxiredoxin